LGRLQRVFLTHSRAPLFRTLHPVHRRKSDITTTLPALRRHALATALLRRINRRTQRTTSATRLVFRTTGPTAVVAISALMCCDIDARGFPWSGASLEVLVPATLAGCARAVRGGRPPDDPASAFPIIHRPARLLCKATCRRRGFSFALAVFRWSGFVAMQLAWRTRFHRSDAFQSNPSLARRG
jgi:hypothetical protein